MSRQPTLRSVCLSDPFILTLSCPDRAGIVHAVTGFVGASQGNITEAAQYKTRAPACFLRGCVLTALTAQLWRACAGSFHRWQTHCK